MISTSRTFSRLSRLSFRSVWCELRLPSRAWCHGQQQSVACSTSPGTSNEGGFVIQPVGEKDMVGPPDKISNIRPVLFHVPTNESAVEKEYRLNRQQVLQWNQEFWTKHNTKFVKEKEEFIKNEKKKKALAGGGSNETLSADEMSLFYKRFLDENWQVHVKYNAEWYKKNIGLMLQSFKVQLFKTFGRNK